MENEKKNEKQESKEQINERENKIKKNRSILRLKSLDPNIS